MADKDRSGFGKSFGKAWLVIGVALIAVAFGAYLVVSGQFGNSKTVSSVPSSPDAVLKNAVFPVEGMSCGACAARIKTALREMDGVGEIEVSLAERNVRVSYADGKVAPEKLVAAINALGYKARHPAAVESGAKASDDAIRFESSASEPQTKSISIPVEEMACESCAATLEGRLKGIGGVKNVRVGLKEKEARIEYSEGTVTPERFVEAIEAQGFKAGNPIVKGEK
jgi:copper ion binding protein